MAQRRLKRIVLKEAKVMSLTNDGTGETKLQPMDDDLGTAMAGTEFTDNEGNRIKVKDTGKRVTEAEGDQQVTKLNQQDILNLAKDLDVCTKEALRNTGSKVAYTQQYLNKAKNAIVIVVAFQEDSDNPGKPSEKRFEYKLAQGKVMYSKGEDKYINVAAIDKQSGTANINRDVATDVMKKVCSEEVTDAKGQAGSETEQEPQAPEAPQQGDAMLESFGKAVEAYRKNKSKETIKELLRCSRDFPGDDIQHKFANAVQAYKGQSCCPDGECSDCEIKMSESLLIRLLEFAKEDAQNDLDIHEIAENISRICNEKGFVAIEDYESIIGTEANENPEDQEQLQEGDDFVQYE